MKRGETPVPEKDQTICCHHWVIAPAAGPLSAGVCQKCGEAKEFQNHVEASTWGDDITKTNAANTNRGKKRPSKAQRAAQLELDEAMEGKWGDDE